MRVGKNFGVRVACHRFGFKAQDKAQTGLRTPKTFLECEWLATDLSI
jgi:hypothetical protein